MCTHFFRLTTAPVCACGLTPLERDIIGDRGEQTNPHSDFLSSVVDVGVRVIFFIFMCVYPSRGVVHFFYYRSEFQSRFCRVGLKAYERTSCIAL